VIDPNALIARLGLQPHPEGGHYRETFRDAFSYSGERAYSTAIYFLLKAGEQSRWHRIDAAEIWHFYAGDPLELRIASRPDDAMAEPHTLGLDFAAGQRPQIVVPPGQWQAARPLGAYTLVGCTVAPGFDFSKFELAP
jgi:predicted cupin superfamily sugar epimerase